MNPDPTAIDFIGLMWRLLQIGLVPEQAGCGKARANSDDIPAREIPEIRFVFPLHDGCANMLPSVFDSGEAVMVLREKGFL